MKTIFMVPVEYHSPIWPSHYDDAGNLVVKSVSCIGQGPIVGTWLGLIETVTDAGMSTLKSNPRFLFIEDVVEVLLA